MRLTVGALVMLTAGNQPHPEFSASALPQTLPADEAFSSLPSYLHELLSSIMDDYRPNIILIFYLFYSLILNMPSSQHNYLSLIKNQGELISEPRLTFPRLTESGCGAEPSAPYRGSALIPR
jgi:hypothetical protein